MNTAASDRSDPPGRPRVLMIDDNVGDQQLVAIALAEAGAGVELDTAADGIEGRAALQAMADGRRARWRLVLLDLNMPRLDGRQVLAWARAQAGLRGLPLLVLTSSSSPRDRSECLALGADEVLVKPTDYAGFVALAQRLRAMASG